MNSHFISFLLLLIFVITIVNLYYRPYWAHAPQSGVHDIQWDAIDPIDASLCSVAGFRCPNPSHCDCAAICKGDAYEKMTVLEGEDVIVQGEKYLPGTYCVPKGWSDCNLKSSVLVFSASGWFCKNKALWRGHYHVACKNPRAVSNRDNVLVDLRTNRSVEPSDLVGDIYDGERYGCRCGSLDVRGNRMIHSLPFVCSVDYCVEEMINVPQLGWRQDRCECGPYLHRDPDDPASKCVAERTRVDERLLKFYGRVECTNDRSTKLKPIYCPDDREVLRFQKNITFSADIDEYVSRHENELSSLLEDGSTTQVEADYRDAVLEAVAD